MPSIMPDLDAAIAGITDGATVLIGGFGFVGQPVELIEALLEGDVRDLTVVNNNAGNGEIGLAALIAGRRVRKVICSFPRQDDSQVFDALYRADEVELEVIPQGTLAERMRAAGAGLGGFFCPTGVGTMLAAEREARTIDGRDFVLELPLPGDFALIKALRADELGNLTYHKTARNFNPVMATAAAVTIVQVELIVAAGELDPESIVTPGIYVDRIVEVAPASLPDPVVAQ